MGVRLRTASHLARSRLAAAVGAGATVVAGASLLAAGEASAVAPGVLSIFAGTGTGGAPTPGPATSSNLGSPRGVAVDASGNVYIAANNLVLKVTPAGTLSVFAGTGTLGAPTPGPATSSNLGGIAGVAVDRSGNVYITDPGNKLVEKITPAGTLSVLAGTGTRGAPTPGPATRSNFRDPFGVAVDRSGNVYITDDATRLVGKVTPAGTLSIFSVSDQAPSGSVKVNNEGGGPVGVAVDASGNVYTVAVGSPAVVKITPAGTRSLFADIRSFGAPATGPDTTSNLVNPLGVAVDKSGNVYIADAYNNLVKKVTPAGTLSVIAGTGTRGAPTPGPATSSNLDGPVRVAVDASGNVYIADQGNNLVEKVEAAGAPAARTPTVVAVAVAVALALAVGLGLFGLARRRPRSSP